jgi:predicted transglutaminase-like cysteine proteinase
VYPSRAVVSDEHQPRRRRSAGRVSHPTRLWRALNRLRWFWRYPLKVAAFLLVTALVLYPKPWLLPTAVARYRDMNSVLDPTNPQLVALQERVRSRLPADAPMKETLQAVQQVVCERIPYAWDWDVWGVCEYLPTVDEVFQKGREDCDGRAVVAASLLRRMGYNAWLVSDLLHVWVQTPEGETMSPTGAEKTFVGTEAGTQATLSARLIQNLGRGLSYGVAVFPLIRELIILATLCVLAVQPWSSVWRRVAGCIVLLIALYVLRDAGRQVAMNPRTLDLVRTMAGVALALVGWITLAVRVGGSPRDSAATPPE